MQFFFLVIEYVKVQNRAIFIILQTHYTDYKIVNYIYRNTSYMYINTFKKYIAEKNVI